MPLFPLRGEDSSLMGLTLTPWRLLTTCVLVIKDVGVAILVVIDL